MRETAFVLLCLQSLFETCKCICMTAGMHSNSYKYLYFQPPLYSFYNFHKPPHFNSMELLWEELHVNSA